MTIITSPTFNNIETYKKFVEETKCEEYVLSLPQYDFFVDTNKFTESYRECSPREYINIIPRTKITTPTEYNTLRTRFYTGYQRLVHYCSNNAYNFIKNSKQVVVFNASKTTIQNLSNDINIPIWYFGKYYKRAYSVYMINNYEFIKNINSNDILYANKNLSNVFDIDVYLNHKIFLLHDRLIKYYYCPFVLNGNLNLGSVRNDPSNIIKFIQ